MRGYLLGAASQAREAKTQPNKAWAPQEGLFFTF